MTKRFERLRKQTEDQHSLHHTFDTTDHKAVRSEGSGEAKHAIKNFIYSLMWMKVTNSFDQQGQFCPLKSHKFTMKESLPQL